MIDICTIVFRDELPILQVQAQSIGLYCQNLGVRNVYVVINDDETLAAEIDPAWWGPMASHVLVVPRTAFSAGWIENGWVSQQVWKLLVPTMSYNFYTMILDAKTVVISPLSLTRLCDSQGRINAGRAPIPPAFEPSAQICRDLLGVTVDEQICPTGVPYFVHNDTVRFMISDLTMRTRESFPAWFQRQGVLTEFILYSAYNQFKYNSLDTFYNKTCKIDLINLTMCNAFEHSSLLEQMTEDHIQFVSIHRDVWPVLTDEQRQNYRMLLLDRGLTAAWDL